jgi:hypothetical protein
MILCTNCGTRNPDDAQACEKCGRKLQSRWSLSGGQGGQNGSGGSRFSSLSEPVWHAIEPLVHTIEEGADQLVKACAETWVYALILIAGVGGVRCQRGLAVPGWLRGAGGCAGEGAGDLRIAGLT